MTTCSDGHLRMEPAAKLASKVGELRDFGRSHGLDEESIDECLTEALEVFTSKRQSSTARQSCLCRLYGSVALVLVVILFAAAGDRFHRPVQKFVTRQTLPLIYPFMRYWRIITLPILQHFPAIMGWHEQQCLVYNPFYRNQDLRCWPCETVQALADLTSFVDFTTSYYMNETPFVIKNMTAEPFTLAMLKNLYASNMDALDKGTTLFKTSLSSRSVPKDVLNFTMTPSDLHVRWRFRRVSSARVLRQAFRRPLFIPNTTEVSLERHIFVDGPTSPSYSLPLTEFANVWLMQGSGVRPVVLVPSPHCRSNCTAITTVILPGNILFYNWQFWRATFLPSETADVVLTYMGSCY